MINIYTDGACKGNPGPGGWGALINEDGNTKEIFGGETNTTNNRMEILAVIMALNEVVSSKNEITVFTDSKYVQNGINVWILKWKNNGWKTSNKKEVKNRDLWIELDILNEKLNINWIWVKGHSGHPENDRADFLANQGVGMEEPLL